MLVRGRRRHLGAETEARPVAPGQEDVRHETCARRVIARVVERDVHRSGHRVGREPMVEAVRAAVRVTDGARRRPGRSLVVRDRGEDVGVRGRSLREVHPGAGDAAAVGGGGAVGIASRVDQGAAVELGGNPDVERDLLGGDGRRRPPRHAAVERAVEDDGVCREVVPRDVDLAGGTRGDRRADRAARTIRVVDPGSGE